MNRFSSRRSFRRSRPFSHYAMIIGVLALGIMILAYQIGNSKAWASEKLAREGYTKVELTGWKPLTLWCSGREGIAQGFRGRDARGEARQGYVCSNLFFSYIID